ncbi:insulinase family protein [Robertkochia marina]|uniref:Insulinase family protein n=1 Tax=Robertkochia marina TaxID=1227945 RepID=A0A4S3M3G4_9FLAO|nr:pitrilysin family protein [Robertkochia marina]THD69285.1 insulinase family protein [Robertkochia marina]TRZ47456.1 insulinase family protein [Robertkochia marina]
MRLFLMLTALAFTLSLSAQNFKAADINIEYEKFVLPNGLTLLVHEDHKAPIVAVNMWYHVGSKNEKPGKSGFAHLFEHLMFNGSENFNDDYFQAIERIGGTDVNGTTNSDRTNYFQNVPVSALDQVLFLESDRMGYMLGAITQELLDEQRGVVQNEKRQGENQPYGKQWNYLTKAMFPKGHPYSWTVIGEMEDLNAATLDDVKEWFKSYYGPNNAVIAIAGDITPEVAYEKTLKYFGEIPAGPTIERQEINLPDHPYDTHQVYQDRVPESRITFAWISPPFGQEEDLHLDLVSAILSSGKTSRLYNRLVYNDQIASNVSAFQASSEIASNYVIQANVKPGEDPERVKQVLMEEVDRFITEGPTEEELKRVKSAYFANFIKGLERIGGFGGVSDILASNQTYFGDASYYKTMLQYAEKATVADLQAVAAKWLTKGKHILECHPFPEYTITDTSVDRSKLPALTAQKSSKFPELERAKLSNGLNIVLARRTGVPTIAMQMMFDAGTKTDVLGKPGNATLAMNLLDEGTKTMSTLEISEKLQMLGASMYTGSGLDNSSVNMSTLKPTLDESLDLFADVIQNPAFPAKEFERLKKDQINTIKREKSQPIGMALRGMTKYMYGEDHPYGNPYTGSGYEETVEAITLDNVEDFHKTWLRPNNATLVVTGDVDMKSLTTKLEKAFSGWKKGDIPEIKMNKPSLANQNTLYLIDRPESQQSVIIAGHLTDAYGAVNEIAREQMVNILGGEFTSRINMNLREDKHWAYGAGGFVMDTKAERPFIVYAPVQTDKTAESVLELRKELSEFVSTRPATQEELDKVKTNRVLALPGQWETNAAVNSSVANIVNHDLPDDYYQTYDKEVRDLDLATLKKVSETMVKPEEVRWFIVGDKAKIAAKLDELGFENIVEIDADGNPIRESTIPEKPTELKN